MVSRVGLEVDGFVVRGEEKHEMEGEFPAVSEITGNVIGGAERDVIDDVAGRCGGMHAGSLVGFCGRAGMIEKRGRNDSGVAGDAALVFIRCSAGVVVEAGFGPTIGEWRARIQ